MKSSTNLIVVITLLLLTSCIADLRSIRIEKSIKDSEKIRFLKEDFVALIKSPPIDSSILTSIDSTRYQKLFGKMNTLSLIQFLGDRIHFIIDLRDKTDNLLAQNYGIYVYNQAIIDGTLYSVEFDDEIIPIFSSRVGFIGLGDGYPDFYSAMMPYEGRLQTILHEARHSDCPKRPTKEELQSGAVDCGYLHSYCPQGHQYEGIMACDQLTWGAYAVAAIYSEVAMYKYLHRAGQTRNSIDLTRYSVMAVQKVDNYSRLLYNTDELDTTSPNLDSR